MWSFEGSLVWHDVNKYSLFTNAPLKIGIRSFQTDCFRTVKRINTCIMPNVD